MPRQPAARNHAADELSALLDALLSLAPVALGDCSHWTKRTRDDLRRRLKATKADLESLLSTLDPVRQPPMVLDPASPEVVGRLIGDTMLVQQRMAVAELSPFYGSGVYAIYYDGNFPAYQPLRRSETPIYIGKADPAKPAARSPEEQQDRLFRRLSDHVRSLTSADNLAVEDFSYRYLVVVSAWQITSETYLIERFHPVWNRESKVCYGFGKHGDAPLTRANSVSPWDTLHAGRRWAGTKDSRANAKSSDQIVEDIAEHFRKYPPEY